MTLEVLDMIVNGTIKTTIVRGMGISSLIMEKRQKMRVVLVAVGLPVAIASIFRIGMIQVADDSLVLGMVFPAILIGV